MWGWEGAALEPLARIQHVCVCMCVRMHVVVCVCVCMWLYVCAYACGCMCVRMHVVVCVCVCMWLYVCLFARQLEWDLEEASLRSPTPATPPQLASPNNSIASHSHSTSPKPIPPPVESSSSSSAPMGTEGEGQEWEGPGERCEESEECEWEGVKYVIGDVVYVNPRSVPSSHVTIM